MNISSRAKYNSGQVVYGENEQGGNLYIVKSGKLRVYRMGKNMSEVELATLEDGGYLR